MKSALSANYSVTFRHQYHTLNMPWDNSVNKNSHIYAVVTTIDVENMPLISWVIEIEAILMDQIKNRKHPKQLLCIDLDLRAP